MDDVRSFSDFLAEKAFNEAECFPVDRYFLKPYLNKIYSFDRNDFLVCNFEKVNINYSVRLMLCLPELWENIAVDDIINFIRRFRNEFSYYAIIKFTYKYIEVNIINLLVQLDFVSVEIKYNILNYLYNSEYPNLIKTEGDYFFFDEGLYGVKNEEWMNIKQRLLLDERLKPALVDEFELRKYIEHLAEIVKDKYSSM